MIRPAPPHARRRGLTLIELMLALTITVFIGGGLASVLTMVSQVSAHERDARTGSLRAHAAQIRMQAYTETALCVLQSNDSGEFALWLEDADNSGTVNVTEFRVFWADDLGRITCERVVIPDTWTEEQIDLYDIELPASFDFFNAMLAQRRSKMTESVVIVDGVASASITHDAVSPQGAARFRYLFTQAFPSGAEIETLIALPLANYRAPDE